MTYHVTSRNKWGQSQTHIVVFSIALRQAFERAKLEFNRKIAYRPTARNLFAPFLSVEPQHF